MNTGKAPQAAMSITGGTFIGSAVGQANTISHNTIAVGVVASQASLDDLRAAIAAVRDDLIAAAADPAGQADVCYEVGKIEEELAGAEPEGAVVRSRWAQVGKMLGPLAAASGHIAQITNLITKVFDGG
ncbi:MAG: hypothetical protein ACRDSR_03590 [Pseudonocardiaceae bacterium]